MRDRHQRCGEYLDESVAQLGSIAADAVGVLRAGPERERFSERLRATEVALKLLLPDRRQVALEDRISVLEELLEQDAR